MKNQKPLIYAIVALAAVGAWFVLKMLVSILFPVIIIAVIGVLGFLGWKFFKKQK